MAEVAYAAEFFRWFARGGRAHRRRVPDARRRRNRILVTQPAGRCGAAHHAVELPRGDGDAQDRPGAGRRLHRGAQGRRARRRSPRWRWPTSWPRPACPPASSTWSCPTPPGRRRAGDARAGLVRKLSFTGSTEVGAHAAGAGRADAVVNCSMELGGNAPFVVFADADLDAAVDGAMMAKMRNGGEACTAANRFYVAARSPRTFTDALAARMAALKVGPRHSTPARTVGPLVDAAPARQGGRPRRPTAAPTARTVVVGGDRPDGPGFFYPPTVLARRARRRAGPARGDLRAGGAHRRVRRPTPRRRARQRHRARPGGLRLHAATWRAACGSPRRSRAGMVGLNRGLVSDPAAPFGGVKQSGIGREGGHEGLLEFLEQKYVAGTLVMELREVVQRRRMVRRFDQRPVPAALVDRVLDLAPAHPHRRLLAGCRLRGARHPVHRGRVLAHHQPPRVRRHARRAGPRAHRHRAAHRRQARLSGALPAVRQSRLRARRRGQRGR